MKYSQTVLLLGSGKLKLNKNGYNVLREMQMLDYFTKQKNNADATTEEKSRHYNRIYSLYFHLYGEGYISSSFKLNYREMHLLWMLLDKDSAQWYHSACFKFDRSHENFLSNRTIIQGLITFYKIPHNMEELLLDSVCCLTFERFFIACEEAILPRCVADFLKDDMHFATFIKVVKTDIGIFSNPPLGNWVGKYTYNLTDEEVSYFKSKGRIRKKPNSGLSYLKKEDPPIEDEESTEELSYSIEDSDSESSTTTNNPRYIDCVLEACDEVYDSE